ncbi:MAG: hypothetical protein JSR92_16305 [Proteobacteria bacterium]|nr:hypothetical protein [Pseudomonadota bacterium]
MKDRIAAWKQAFEQDDHAVLPSLTTFAWDFATYLVLVRIVEDAPVDRDGRKMMGALLLELLRKNFWESTVLAVRRLLDKSPLGGKKGVCSLAAIVADVKACRNRLNRRVFVEGIAGLEYDDRAIEERYHAYVRERINQGTMAFGIPRELQYENSRDRHKQFDFLSGVAADQRSEHDLIRPEIFEALEGRLDRLAAVADHADTHFAHAATEFSRRGRVLNNWGVTEARDALELLTQTAELVGRWFVFTGVGDILPTAQFDKFAHLDRPLIQPNSEERLEQVWDEFAAVTARWPFIDDDQV